MGGLFSFFRSRRTARHERIKTALRIDTGPYYRTQGIPAPITFPPELKGASNVGYQVLLAGDISSRGRSIGFRYYKRSFYRTKKKWGGGEAGWLVSHHVTGSDDFFYAMIRGIPTFENPDNILFGIAGTISGSGTVDVVYLKPAATIDSASIEQALKYAEALLNETIA